MKALTVVVALATFGALAGGIAGCYHPKIENGAIFCGPQNACPTGYACAVDARCYTTDTVGMVSPPPTPIPSPFGTGELGALDLTGMTGVLMLSTNDGGISFFPTGGGDVLMVPAVAVFAHAQSSGPPVAIWNFTVLNIPTTVTVQVTTNSLAIPVFAATQSITIAGVVSLDGVGGLNGAASTSGHNPDSAAAGAGGGAADGSGGGGGGGAYGTNGATGSGSGGVGGLSYGTPTVLPVLFGAGGGGGGALASAPSPLPGVGGPGGGAIGLLSPTVEIDGTISVNGIDGATGNGGGGGGAGGSILISAGIVTIGAGATLSAMGGHGGVGAAGGSGGGDGGTGRIYITATTLNAGGNVTPAADIGAAPLTSFPR